MLGLQNCCCKLTSFRAREVDTGRARLSAGPVLAETSVTKVVAWSWVCSSSVHFLGVRTGGK